jgi:hypothetical protein
MTDRKWWDLWWDWRAELEPSTPWSALARSAARGARARDLFLSFVDTVRDDAQCCTSKLISSGDRGLSTADAAAGAPLGNK